MIIVRKSFHSIEIFPFSGSIFGLWFYVRISSYTVHLCFIIHCIRDSCGECMWVILHQENGKDIEEGRSLIVVMNVIVKNKKA